MTVAYFDCFSGVSGDMTLGALVHLGVPVEWLNERLRRLPLTDFEITAETVSRSGIQAVRVHVHTEETHHHRGWQDIQRLIQSSDQLSERVKAHSLEIFERLADAEAKVHGCTKASVHFHEVGAIDAIVDIVGACLGFEFLGIETVFASPLPMGRGFVTCAHGVLPVPAPATLEILKGAPIYGCDETMELVTPTGAAIVAGMVKEYALPSMTLHTVGYGAGSREAAGRPNLLRLMVGTLDSEASMDASEKLAMVETCIDDMNPEIFSYLMEMLFDDGALDVFWVPVQMKKNRPGTWVHVLCTTEQRPVVVERLLSETTTLGVRFHEVRRTSLAREAVEVNSAFGVVMAKKVTGLDGVCRIVPEYEVCKRIAQNMQKPLQEVYETILRTARPTAKA